MVTLLVVLAVLAWIVGGFLLTQATYGVGVLAAGCLLAILARIAQAGNQHRELMRVLRSGLDVPTTPVPAAEPSSDDGWTCRCGYRNQGRFYDCTGCGAVRPQP